MNLKRAHAGMLVWTLIVGMSFPAVGLLSEGLPPLLLTAIRFAVAALFLWLLIRRASDRVPDWRGLMLYVGMGLCLAGFFGTMFWAAHRTSALSMATLYVSVPLLAYGLGRALGVEHPALRLLAILATGAAGALALALAESGGADGGFAFGPADGAFFLGCVASALYPVLSKWGLKRGWLSDNAAIRTFWSLAAGGIVIGAAGLVVEAPGTLARLTPSDVALVVYLGVFSSGITFWLQQRATAVLTPGAVTAYSYLVPFVSMLMLFATRPEMMGWHWLPGSVLVLLAIALLLRRDMHARAHRIAGSAPMRAG